MWFAIALSYQLALRLVQLSASHMIASLLETSAKYILNRLMKTIS